MKREENIVTFFHWTLSCPQLYCLIGGGQALAWDRCPKRLSFLCTVINLAAKSRISQQKPPAKLVLQNLCPSIIVLLREPQSSHPHIKVIIQHANSFDFLPFLVWIKTEVKLNDKWMTWTSKILPINSSLGISLLHNDIFSWRNAYCALLERSSQIHLQLGQLWYLTDHSRIPKSQIPLSKASPE